MRQDYSKSRLPGAAKTPFRLLSLAAIATLSTLGLSLPTIAASLRLETAIGRRSGWRPESPMDASTLLAQATDANSVLLFDTPNHVVRIFTQAGGQRMNVYNRPEDLTVLEGGAIEFQGYGNDGFANYIAYGTRGGRPVSYRVRYNPGNRQATLDIRNIANNQPLAVENSTGVRIARVPQPETGPTANLDRDTILAFETGTYAVRVLRRNDEGRFMNVYNKLTQQTVLNGVGTSVAPPASPYADWVSYVSAGDFSGIAAQYFARISPGGQTRLDIVNSQGAPLTSETGIGPVVVQIPPADIPVGRQAPVGRSELAPYIAAVFGDENTLSQIEQQVPEAQNPTLENTRLGRFINAGNFNDRNEAAALVSLLRARGFNARLIFRDFNYR